MLRLVGIGVLYFGVLGLVPAQTLRQSHLPIVIIHTHGQPVPDTPKIMADMRIVWDGAGGENFIADTASHYLGRIGIELRGSSSLSLYPKKQYALETRHEDGSNRNVSLLGLPAENDWVLHAPYSDKTMMRNVLVYALARRMGRYAPRCRYCELLLNGAYQGIYVLMEKIKRDRGRVAIANLNPEDHEGDAVTGGYLFKIDKGDGDNTGGWPSLYPPYEGAWQTVGYQYHHPDENELTPVQKAYIQDKMNAFERLLFSSALHEAPEAYSAMLDLHSFVDMVLLQELAKNVDAYRLSQFFYKDRDSNDPRIKAGPVWDFNLGFGNANYFEGWRSEGWQMDYIFTNATFKADRYQPPFWWFRLWTDDVFQEKLCIRWHTLKNNVMDYRAIRTMIDSLQERLGPAVQRNFQRWLEVLGQYVWPNPPGFASRPTFAAEVNWLKAWIFVRLSWMDEALANQSAVEEMNSGTAGALMTALSVFPNPFFRKGTIYFKLCHEGAISVKLYDVRGQRLRTLFEGHRPIGAHHFHFETGILPAGVYFCRLQCGAMSETVKLIHLH